MTAVRKVIKKGWKLFSCEAKDVAKNFEKG